MKINNTDLLISPINLGGNVFGWTLDEKQSFGILDKFVDSGFNFIDTADIYSHWAHNSAGGESETIIGNWMKSRNNREDIIIATKVGGASSVHPKDTSKSHILSAIDKSLKRLKTDYIDLYYTHFDDEITPVEETLSAYDELIKAGKVRYIAASNISPERLTKTMNIADKENLPKYVALQPHYNLVVREGFEQQYAPLAKEYEFSVFPYWSLASGFLTGKYRSDEDFNKTARGGGIKEYFDDRGKAILSALDRVSQKHNTTQAAVSLAWLINNPLVTAPIASATKDTHIDTMVNAVNLHLDEDDVILLNKASAK